jgi:hypothetical protein
MEDENRAACSQAVIRPERFAGHKPTPHYNSGHNRCSAIRVSITRSTAPNFRIADKNEAAGAVVAAASFLSPNPEVAGSSTWPHLATPGTLCLTLQPGLYGFGVLLPGTTCTVGLGATIPFVYDGPAARERFGSRGRRNNDFGW